MPINRPSRFYVAKVYLRRILRWRRNSSPYISGDAFADLADFVYNAPRFRKFRKQQIPIQNARTIFCRSEDLDEMLLKHGKRITAKVIICGNSDFEFHEMPRNLPGSVNALFLQNSFISDDKFVFSIPIGIENLRWGVNGNPRLFWRRANRALHKVLFGPFGRTHSIRAVVAGTFKNPDPSWEFLDLGRISPIKYSWLARRYRFIAAVRGNGIDTHRHWETLYRGIAPIVIDDKWSQSLVSNGIPFELIAEWSPNEIRRILSRDIDIDPKALPILWMPHWIHKINLIASHL